MAVRWVKKGAFSIEFGVVVQSSGLQLQQVDRHTRDEGSAAMEISGGLMVGERKAPDLRGGRSDRADPPPPPKRAEKGLRTCGAPGSLSFCTAPGVSPLLLPVPMVEEKRPLMSATSLDARKELDVSRARAGQGNAACEIAG